MSKYKIIPWNETDEDLDAPRPSIKIIKKRFGNNERLFNTMVISEHNDGLTFRKAVNQMNDWLKEEDVSEVEALMIENDFFMEKLRFSNYLNQKIIEYQKEIIEAQNEVVREYKLRLGESPDIEDLI